MKVCAKGADCTECKRLFGAMLIVLSVMAGFIVLVNLAR